MKASLISKLKFVLVVLAIGVFTVLGYGAFRDWPFLLALFFLMIYVPLVFSIALGVSYFFRLLFKRLDLLTSTLGLIFLASGLIALLVFPPDIRPELHIKIKEGFAGNVYYFQREDGNANFNVDDNGLLYIPKKQTAGKQIIINYGDQTLTEEQLKGKVAMYHVHFDGEDESIPFGSFYIERSNGVLVIEQAKKPLEKVEVLYNGGFVNL